MATTVTGMHNYKALLIVVGVLMVTGAALNPDRVLAALALVGLMLVMAASPILANALAKR